MMIERRVSSVLLAAGFCLALSACSESPTQPQVCPAGTTGTPPNCITVRPCNQSVVESGSGSIRPRIVYFDQFSVPETGRLDITVDWTLPATPLGVYLVPANTCNTIEEFNAGSCNFLIRSNPSTQKPRKISTPNFAAGNYKWLIASFGTQEESISYQFVLATGDNCPAQTGTSTGAHSSAAEEMPKVDGMQRR